jgi:peptidoglycan/xylan/chitin deacetylase (PgdA/CDA1 family)
VSTAFYLAKAGSTRARSAAWLMRTRGRLDTSGLRILFYHRVSDDRDELAVTPSAFAEQMDYLASEAYRVVDLVSGIDLLDSGKPLARTVALTFDDGFLDVAEHSLPILSERGFRATVFVAPAVTDGRTSFAWYRGEQPPLLAWEDIVELDRDGTLRFEAHSLTHPNLPALDDDAAAEEIAGSKRELENRLGRVVRAFSYPSGLYGEREERIVAQAGYQMAVACEPGVNHRSTDRFALHRRQVDARDSLLDFRAKLGGGHDSSQPFRGLYRRLRYSAG